MSARRQGREPEYTKVHPSQANRHTRRTRILRQATHADWQQHCQAAGEWISFDEYRRTLRAVRMEGQPDYDVDGFGEYRRNLRKWADRNAVARAGE